MEILIFKITFENVNTGASSEIYINEGSLIEFLSGEQCVSEIYDAKSGEKFTIKERVLSKIS